MCRLVRIRAGSLAAVLLTLTAALQPSPCKRRTLTRRHGFFDVLSDAFANDETVSKLDYGDNAPAAAAPPPREASVDGLWRVEMIVVGVPTKDPSSDLFGPNRSDDGSFVGTPTTVISTRHSPSTLASRCGWGAAGALSP